MPLSGNKGEWSEIYTFLKILGDGKLYAGDENLNRVENLFYPIIKILRTERNGNYEYIVNGDIIIVNSDDEELLTLPITEFVAKAKELLTIMKKGSSSFSAPAIESFMEEIYCHTLKADSGQKTDIRIIVHDSLTGMNPELAFSIKSYIGGSPTLLNASSATNFIFKITHTTLSDEKIAEINAMDSKNKIRDRIEEIEWEGGCLEFSGMENEIFLDNLVMIDSFMPLIIARILYMYFTSDLKTIKELTEKVSEENLLKYDLSHKHKYYEHKMKNLLSAVALGMIPSKPWQGIYESNGGYLVVKSEGEVLCYHFYNRNLFENYLFNNTKLESASTTRHGYASIFTGDDGCQYFKLNLQIRFS